VSDAASAPKGRTAHAVMRISDVSDLGTDGFKAKIEALEKE
jgi:hypothetical protein